MCSLSDQIEELERIFETLAILQKTSKCHNSTKDATCSTREEAKAKVYLSIMQTKVQERRASAKSSN